jgi:3-hydroxyisobutyrate dehydrogenase-like beta-hydroxyacid dehydrogenase
MNSEKMDYKFCADFLRYAYHVMGYDALIREANYIHHLYAPSTDIPTPVPAPVPVVAQIVPDKQDVPETTVSSSILEQADTKNIVIDNNTTKIKYTRSQLSDDLRCTSIISNGTRCTFKKVDNSEHCGRHTIRS